MLLLDGKRRPSGIAGIPTHEQPAARSDLITSHSRFVAFGAFRDVANSRERGRIRRLEMQIIPMSRPRHPQLNNNLQRLRATSHFPRSRR